MALQRIKLRHKSTANIVWFVLCIIVGVGRVSCFRFRTASNLHLGRIRRSPSSTYASYSSPICGAWAHAWVPHGGVSPIADRRKRGRAVCMSTGAGSQGASGVLSFFGSAGIARAMQVTSNVPPVYYFLYLLAAGIGVPVSEDVLLIFVGTSLGRGDLSLSHKLASVAWCYAGVVLSDYITYSIGAGFRRGLLNPLRRLLFRDLDDDVGSSTGEAGPTGSGDGSRKGNRGSTAILLERIRRSGRFVGVAERFAVGARGPMTLLCGFTAVPFKSFSAGVAIGALCSMSIQLTLGHLLRDRPGTVGAIAATFVSFYAFTPAIVAALGALGLWLDGKRTPGDGKAGSAGTVRRLDTPRNASDMGT